MREPDLDVDGPIGPHRAPVRPETVSVSWIAGLVRQGRSKIRQEGVATKLRLNAQVAVRIALADHELARIVGSPRTCPISSRRDRFPSDQQRRRFRCGVKPVTKFIFIDDTYDPKIRRFTLTGVVLPVEQYGAVTAAFYAILKPFIVPSEGIVNLHPPELHGVDFMRSEDDATKFNTLRQLVELVNRFRLRVVRVGCVDNEPLQEVFEGNQPAMWGHCWFRFQERFEWLIAEGLLIPIMDAVDREKVRHFSGQMRVRDVLRAAGLGGALSPPSGSENVLGEVFYAESRYASMIQLADCVSYLLNAEELVRYGAARSPFKSAIADISRKLDTTLVDWERREMMPMQLVPTPPPPQNAPSGSTVV
jgi:hypothetical protein